MTISPASETSRAWVDVDLGALVRNARSFIDRTGVPMLAMVKANGYGLGTVATARALDAVAPWGFGVTSTDEARQLRTASIGRRIVVFTSLTAANIDATLEAHARPAIGDVAALHAWLITTAEPFHLEIDTGMARSGIRWDDEDSLREVRDLLRDAQGWEGIFTMFHSAERDHPATLQQWKRFQDVIGFLGRPALVHAAASAGGIYGSEFAGDITRPGLHLYGGQFRGLPAESVAALRARVVGLRTVRAGDTVGYDATWTATRATCVATLSIGYADGVHRSLSNRGLVELDGERFRIVGRLTMDQMMVDVADHAVAIGDVATLFGGAVTLEEQAALAGTVPYELLTALGARLPRRYQQQP